MTLNPMQSGEFIVKHAQHVKVHETGIKNLANQVLIFTFDNSKTIYDQFMFLQIIEAILDGSLSIDNFSQCEFHPKVSDSNALHWILILDTLNFCFWNCEGQQKV